MLTQFGYLAVIILAFGSFFLETWWGKFDRWYFSTMRGEGRVTYICPKANSQKAKCDKRGLQKNLEVFRVEHFE